MRNYYAVFLVVMTVIFSACHSTDSGDSSQTQDSIVFNDLDSLKLESLNHFLTGITDSNGIDKITGKGKTWRLWRSLHKDCQNDDVAKDKVYFGVSNTLGIGTIVEISEDGKIMPDFKLLKENLTPEQVKVVYNDGVAASCTYDRTTKVGIDFLAQSQFNTASSADLNAAIVNSKEITAKMDSWQINNLLKGGLATILINPTAEHLKDYKKRLTGENRYVISNEIVVNGFSAMINTKTQISADLKAKLQAGLVQNVGDTAAQVKFSYVDDTTIRMSTVGKFIVFCTLIEAKFVN